MQPSMLLVLQGGVITEGAASENVAVKMPDNQVWTAKSLIIDTYL